MRLLYALSAIPVSLLTMLYGWGIPPVNWGWIAFGYLWVTILPLALHR